MLTRASVVTGAGDGLFSLLLEAAKNATAEAGAPLGVLEITRGASPEDPPGDLSIEAVLAHEGGLRLRRIDVKVGVTLDQPASSELVGEALERFGGTAFTNLCLEAVEAEKPQTAKELLDVTVTFPSRFGFYARNYALIADDLDPGEVEVIALALTELGVGYRTLARGISVRAHELRRRMKTERQLSSFLALSRRQIAIQLYCSRLPPAQSLRLLHAPLSGPAQGRQRFECIISRGMARAELPIEQVSRELEQFVTRRFGLEFSGHSWTVENTHGDRPPLRLGVLGDRRGIRWSVNWGHRRE